MQNGMGDIFYGGNSRSHKELWDNLPMEPGYETEELKYGHKRNMDDTRNGFEESFATFVNTVRNCIKINSTQSHIFLSDRTAVKSPPYPSTAKILQQHARTKI